MTRNLGLSRRRLPRHLIFEFATPLLTAAVFAVVLVNAGCASPGEPSARKPPVPETVGNLAASQYGNSVLLIFTVPQDSLGGTPLEHTPTVQIYRDFETAPAAGELRPAAPKRPTLLTTVPSDLVPQYTTHGQFRYLDRFDPADFAAHPDSMAVYSVRTRIAAKKLSALSNLAALRLYPAPERISDLQANVTPTAVVLSWTAPQRTPLGPVPPLARYDIYRGEAQGQSKSPASSQAQQSLPASAPLPGAVPSPPALQSPLVKIGEAASASFSDSHAEFGETYAYSVRSVVDYSGAAVESGDSNFLTITPRDIFPPAAPSGLIGIFVPGSSGVTAHIDLSWAVSPETDLAGYHVYRGEQAGVLGAPLDAQLLLTPAFRDMNIVSGRRYFYSVTAVDRSGNESQPSAAVSVSVPDATQPSHD
jgi:hypothetical protein